MVRVAFPARSRVIPTAAQSVVVQVVQGATVVNQATLTTTSPQTTFTEVPVGSVTVKAFASPNSAGTGTPMATAQTIQTVVNGGTAAVDLTMASTIDHLSITPNPINLALTGVVTRQVTVTAYDASNAVVLTAPGDLSYSSSGVSIFLVGSTGLVTGIALGNATLTATDAISGKSATAPVHVTVT